MGWPATAGVKGRREKLRLALPGDVSLLISLPEVPPTEGGWVFLFFNVSKAGLVTALLCTQYPQEWAPIWVSPVLRHPGFSGVVAASHLPPNPPSPPGQLKCCLDGTHSHHFVLEPSKRGLLTGHLLFFSTPSPEGRPDYGGQGGAPGSTRVRGPPGC